MKKLPYLLTVLALAISMPNVGAQHRCGTVLENYPDIEQDRWDRFKARWHNQRAQREAVNLGITIHIVTGAVEIPIQQLYNELDIINNMYAASGLQFFFCGAPRVIQGNRTIYTYGQAASELNARHHVPNTINIFYLDEIGDQQFSQFACGISTFPFDSKPSQRFIIMQKGCSTNGSTLAHEIGHLFGLLHTHETFFGREFVDGSNCLSAGDRICDTPADPNLGLTGVQGCTYSSLFVDGNGDTFRPDPTNLMSYAPSGCRQRFSPGQNEMMNFWYEEELSYLLQDCDFFPDFALSSNQTSLTIGSGQPVSFPVDLTSLGVTEDEELIVHFSLITEGDDLPTIIHKDTINIPAGVESSNFNFDFQFPLTKGTGEYDLTIILDPESTFLERDKRNNFHEIKVSVDNTQYEDRVLFPNPVRDFLKVFVRDQGTGGDVYIELTDLYGRNVLSTKRFKKSAEFFAEVDLRDLPPGTYSVSIYFERDDEIESYLIRKQ